MLLFDGQRFCQDLRGPADAIDALMDRIARDPRHEQLVVLIDAPVVPIETPRWRAGYCEPNALDALDAATPPRPAPADAIFQAVLAAADLS